MKLTTYYSTSTSREHFVLEITSIRLSLDDVGKFVTKYELCKITYLHIIFLKVKCLASGLIVFIEGMRDETDL